MRQHLSAALVLVAFAAAGCTPDATGPTAAELMLAQDAQGIAQSVAATSGATHDGWLARLLDTLRTTDDPEARAFLEQARAYHDSAHAARAAGRLELARHYARLSFRAILSGVIELFPNAPARTGNAVDQALARIEQHLGDRDAPRIRRVLAHVRELRTAADAALANGEPVTALALNLRGMQILHRLVEHLRDGMDHDGVADGEMHGDGR